MPLENHQRDPGSLIVMAGLPGVGKSTVAQALGRSLPAVVLAVDAVEAALLRTGIEAAQPTGLAAYVVVDEIAERLLEAGQRVIIDAVNAVEPARQQWRALAQRRGVPLRVIEVVCTDEAVHRRRLENRERALAPVPEPSWDDVVQRRQDYAVWENDRLILDTMVALEQNVAQALAYVAQPCDQVGKMS